MHMARIRSVHPGVWTDEAYVSVSAYARLLAIGLWNECDDGGAFEWKVLQLKMRLLPADNVDIQELLSELEAAEIICRYEWDGKAYGAVRNFGKWQRPQKPVRRYPMLKDMREFAATAELACEVTGDTITVPVSDQYRTGTILRQQRKEEGGKREEEGDKNTPARRPSADGELEREFEQFWKIYPRKDDKGHARKAWKAARKLASFELIMSAVQRYDFASARKYIPLPSTWLNGERWTSEIDDFDPVLRAVGLEPPDHSSSTSDDGFVLQ